MSSSHTAQTKKLQYWSISAEDLCMVAAFDKFFCKIVQIIHLNAGKPNCRNQRPSFQIWIPDSLWTPEKFLACCGMLSSAVLFFQNNFNLAGLAPRRPPRRRQIFGRSLTSRAQVCTSLHKSCGCRGVSKQSTFFQFFYSSIAKSCSVCSCSHRNRRISEQSAMPAASFSHALNICWNRIDLPRLLKYHVYLCSLPTVAIMNSTWTNSCRHNSNPDSWQAANARHSHSESFWWIALQRQTSGLRTCPAHGRRATSYQWIFQIRHFASQSVHNIFFVFLGFQGFFKASYKIWIWSASAAPGGMTLRSKAHPTKHRSYPFLCIAEAIGYNMATQRAQRAQRNCVSILSNVPFYVPSYSLRFIAACPSVLISERSAKHSC